jgi:hypothetical protein
MSTTIEESAWLDEEDNALTLKDVRDAIRPLAPLGQGSKEQVIKVLERVAGVSRLEDIPPEKFAAAIEAFDEIFNKLSKPRIPFSHATVLEDGFQPLLKILRERGPELNLMARAGRIVHVMSRERSGMNGSKTQVLELAALSEPTLAADLTSKITFQKIKGTGNVPADCPPRLSAALAGAACLLPEITVRAIAETPLLIDGELRATRGFDRQLGIWMDAPDVKVPEVCDKAAAQRALDYLKDWLSEFPFASEIDRSAALAALLTSALRASLDLAPGFVISKPDFSVGASTLCELINVILTGRPAAAINADKSREEIDKAVDSDQRAAIASLCIDNVPEGTVFNSTAVAQVLTAKTRRMRILGKSDTIDVDCTQLVMINGVNIRVANDLASRAVHM